MGRIRKLHFDKVPLTYSNRVVSKALLTLSLRDLTSPLPSHPFSASASQNITYAGTLVPKKGGHEPKKKTEHLKVSVAHQGQPAAHLPLLFRSHAQPHTTSWYYLFRPHTPRPSGPDWLQEPLVWAKTIEPPNINSLGNVLE